MTGARRRRDFQLSRWVVGEGSGGGLTAKADGVLAVRQELTELQAEKVSIARFPERDRERQRHRARQRDR